MAYDVLAYGGAYLAPTRNPFNYAKFEQTTRDISSVWITSAQIDMQLNLFGDTSQDVYLSSLELATRMIIEDYLGMAIFAVTYKVYYGASSLYATPLGLDLPEISKDGVTINSVSYYSNSVPSVLTAIDPSTYSYDPTGNKIILTGLPTNISASISNPVVVNYTLNPSTYASYPVIKQAGLLLITHLYNNRSDTTNINLKEIPFGIDMLLRPYKPLVM